MHLSPRTTEVVLFQGDDYDEFSERLAAFERARRAGATRRLTDVAPLDEKAAEYDEFLASAVDRAVKVTLRALSPKKWRELVAAHPMREDDPGDRMGFNVETLCDQLIPVSIIKAICGDECEEFESAPTDHNEFVASLDPDVFAAKYAKAIEFLESLTAGQYDQLYGAAIALNTDAGPDPKARLSSTPVPTGDATSTSPSRLA